MLCSVYFILKGCTDQTKENRIIEAPSIYLVCDSLKQGPDKATESMISAMVFFYRACLASVEGWILNCRLEGLTTIDMLGRKWPFVMALSLFLMEDSRYMIDQFSHNCDVVEKHKNCERVRDFYGRFPRNYSWNKDKWVQNTARYQSHLCAFTKWLQDDDVKQNIRQWEIKLDIIKMPDPEIYVVRDHQSGPVLMPCDDFVSGISSDETVGGDDLVEHESDDDETTCSLPFLSAKEEPVPV